MLRDVAALVAGTRLARVAKIRAAFDETTTSGFLGESATSGHRRLLSRSLLSLERRRLSETGTPERRGAVLGLEGGEEEARSARHSEERISKRARG
jgi:hypothetical protein